MSTGVKVSNGSSLFSTESRIAEAQSNNSSLTAFNKQVSDFMSCKLIELDSALVLGSACSIYN